MIRLSPFGCKAMLEIHLQLAKSFFDISCLIRWYILTWRCVWKKINIVLEKILQKGTTATKKYGLVGWNNTRCTKPLLFANGAWNVSKNVILFGVVKFFSLPETSISIIDVWPLDNSYRLAWPYQNNRPLRAMSLASKAKKDKSHYFNFLRFIFNVPFYEWCTAGILRRIVRPCTLTTEQPYFYLK